MRTFVRFRHPAKHNIVYSQALDEFVASAVLAYECGLDFTSLAQTLAEERWSMEELDRTELEIDTGLVWLALSNSHRPVKRLSTTEPEWSGEKDWLGFTLLIVNAYFIKRWAWFPLQQLQLEQRVTLGRAEPQEIVAERARIVFQTLNKTAKQFPA